tara:strand:+ start:103 stop:489 length:387 start_codon:yes stop_codon:yes gene_type:complete
MAHFARLGVGNTVVRVHVVSNDVATSEQAGIEFLQNLHKTKDVFKQASYNTVGGVHLLGGTPFRKNYPGVGYSYDQSRDAFIPPQRYPSWKLNEESCMWDSPVPYPTDGNHYAWNETKKIWDKIEEIE